MPGFQDSAFIILLALLLFGPKKLPELARQLGKLMAEFRRASNEFRIQMEDELRAAEQEEQRKKIEAMQAAAPATPALPESTEAVEAVASPVAAEHEPVAVEHEPVTPEHIAKLTQELVGEHTHTPPSAATEPLPIATSGELNMMPPSTGLPVSRDTLAPVLDSIPHDPAPETVPAEAAAGEAARHG